MCRRVTDCRRRNPTSRTRVLSDDELKKVWIAAEQTDGHFGVIVRLLITTGQRRGEIAALQSSWIKDDTITLPAAITKNGREHCFPIGARAAQLLTTHEPQTGLFFLARGSEDRPFCGWSNSKEALDQLSGVKNWTLHDLRRTFATRLAEMGVAPHIIERLLNHVSGQISGVAATYNRASFMPEMAQAVRNYEAYLTKVLE